MTKPNEPMHPTGHTQSSIGLTKREYFAAMIIQSMACFDMGDKYQFGEEVAKRAVIQADFLIAELNKESK